MPGKWIDASNLYAKLDELWNDHYHKIFTMKSEDSEEFNQSCIALQEWALAHNPPVSVIIMDTKETNSIQFILQRRRGRKPGVKKDIKPPLPGEYHGSLSWAEREEIAARIKRQNPGNPFGEIMDYEEIDIDDGEED